MNEIEVLGVSKRYRYAASGMPRKLRTLKNRGPRVDHWALRDVSFAVARGETLGVIGKNASGKSTLLRLLAGITRPTRGSVHISRTVSGLLTLGESMHPLLSGEENALTGAILAGLRRAEAQRRLLQIAAFAELEDHMEQPLRTFSDGMRLRLAFAVAVHVDPEILLVDEVLAVGDMRFQEKCFSHLEGLQASGVTVVVASHDLDQIRRLCTRTLWLSRGRVMDIGETDEVADHYRQALSEDAPSREPVTSGGVRHGSGEVEITGVRLFDHRERETSRITPGNPLTVEIDFIAHEEVPDAIFGVSAHAERDGVRCFDIHTGADGRSVGRLHGTGRIRLHLDRLDLTGGIYLLDVGIFDTSWEQTYDYLWQAFALEVSGGDHEVAVLRPPHRWSMQ
ncbi:MAG: ABC transporter ATP-binding protein [Actinomycetota bacterium]